MEGLIRDARVANGRGEVFDPRQFAERVQTINTFVELGVLQRHIEAIVLDRLGVPWDERYGQLTAFKAQHGHCNVPQHYPDNPSLGRWCAKQRDERNTLTQDRIARLETLGFVWEPYDVQWEAAFAELVAYNAARGEQHVPDRIRFDKWCERQRRAKRQGRLAPDRIARLEAVGFFKWGPSGARWDEMYERLVAYRESKGHCVVPVSHTADPELGKWCVSQRAYKKRGLLAPDRTARLEALGFVWVVKDAQWENMFTRLVDYKAKHGDCYVPRSYPEAPGLGPWCNTQRCMKKQGRLTPDRIARLEAVGFKWTLWCPTGRDV